MTELVLERGDVAVSTARKPEVLAGLAAIYPEDRLLILKLDVTNSNEIRDCFAQAERRFGRIDVVFNNAGYGMIGELEGIPENIARGLFDVNFWGAVNVSKEAVRVFREVNRPHGGRLLQMSSMFGVEGNPLFGVYSAAKFGEHVHISCYHEVQRNLTFLWIYTQHWKASRNHSPQKLIRDGKSRCDS